MEKGTMLYHYRIEGAAPYGKGALLMAEHILLGKRFLLKSLTPKLPGTESYRERFYNEAKLLAGMVHPNILQATDFFEHNSGFWLVMEYYNGAALDRMIEHNGPFPQQIALHYAVRLLQGLRFAHDKGVIHRGLTTAIILLDRNGGLKISDFGVALLKYGEDLQEVGQGGEAAFMSPEQILNPFTVTPQSDIYAVGLILYNMLAGRLPFSEESAVDTLMNQFDSTIPDIRSFAPDTHEELAAIVHKALEKDPANRYQSCVEFLAALEAHRVALLPKAPAEGIADSWLRRRRGLVMSSLVSALLLATGGGYYYHWINSYDIILKLQGSNTIGAELAPALAEEFLKKQGAVRIRRVPGKNHEEQLVEGIMEGRRNRAVEIKAHGSTTAFEGLQANACDIGMSSRRIKDDEVKRLSLLGNMTSRANEHVLALDGVAVIVNSTNPVATLTMADTQGLFTGKIPEWKQLNSAAKAAPVHVYARDDKSGTFDTFKSLVLHKEKLVKEAKRFEDSVKLSRDVSSDPNGIGFIGLPYVKSSKAVAISGGAQPILPTPFTVATEDYGLARRLYLYTPGQPKNQKIRDFVEFALSPEGQAIVEKNGFVPLSVRMGNSSIPANAPERYRMLASSAERLSLNVKFTADGQLDNKAYRDLDRLVRALSTKELQGRQLLLFSFTDASSDPHSSLALSHQRVGQVAQELRSRGIMVAAAEGFGSSLPVADNSTKEGRQRNNRVEIWLAKR
ncbi:protein kinase domain-containing protein [Trichlorobacter lovleyi]|uniref:Serine/threonine protein kinase n=1 Tax=Trichlorobacter lovleyi (strain ATCC BAA-1151 / DSM 17278 / SZ) TaxID=398767 RepID=B3E3S4_TRIL1|nr:substrate-binding domain-containing protein [Trichlorobacter lovleyi]ACD94338.1 serine/threonine protein kinase [Trichlorobacter lovleyi SZ]